MSFSWNAQTATSFDGYNQGVVDALRGVDNEFVSEQQYTRQLIDQYVTNPQAEAKKPWFRPDQVVFAAIIITVLMQQFAGISAPFGISAASDPERGDFLDSSSQNCGEVHSLLAGAAPQSWTGSAARTYSTANDTLQELTAQIASLDATMSATVNAQADTVAQTQFGIGIEQDLLLVTYGVVWALEAGGMVSAAWGVALCVSVAALITAGGLLINCHATSNRHADNANKLDYAAVATAARKLITDNQSVGGPAGTPLGDGQVSATHLAQFRGPAAASFRPATGAGPPIQASSTSQDSWRGSTPAQADQPPPRVVPLFTAPAVGQSGRVAHLPGSSTQPGTRLGRQGQQAPFAEAVGFAGNDEAVSFTEAAAGADRYGVSSSDAAGTGASAASAANN